MQTPGPTIQYSRRKLRKKDIPALPLLLPIYKLRNIRLNGLRPSTPLCISTDIVKNKLKTMIMLQGILIKIYIAIA